MSKNLASSDQAQREQTCKVNKIIKQMEQQRNEEEISVQKYKQEEKRRSQCEQQFEELSKKQNSKDNLNQVKADQIKVHEEDMSDDEIQKFSQSSPQKANYQKEIGNQFFKAGKCKEAILQYQKGLKYTDDKKLRATLFSNIVINFIKLEDYHMAIKYSKKILKQDASHVKGRINLARSYEQTNKIQQAFEQYNKLTAQCQEEMTTTDLSFVKQKIMRLKPKVDAINQSRKKQVMDGLKNIGNSILGYFGMSLDNFKFQQGANGGYNISMKQ